MNEEEKAYLKREKEKRRKRDCEYNPDLDYYDILRVSSSASEEVIKRVYKKLADIYHPDHADKEERENAEKQIKNLNNAYEVLSDSEKRREYDKNKKQQERKLAEE